MNWPSLPQGVSIIITTGIGAAIGYLQGQITAGQLPSSRSQWESLGLGAALAFAASVVHLYQEKPGSAKQGPS